MNEAVVAAFNQEKAIVGASSMIVKLQTLQSFILLLLHDLMLGSDTETQQRMFMATEETDAAQIVVSWTQQVFASK